MPFIVIVKVVKYKDTRMEPQFSRPVSETAYWLNSFPGTTVSPYLINGLSWTPISSRYVFFFFVIFINSFHYVDVNMNKVWQNCLNQVLLQQCVSETKQFCFDLFEWEPTPAISFSPYCSPIFFHFLHSLLFFLSWENFNRWAMTLIKLFSFCFQPNV